MYTPEVGALISRVSDLAHEWNRLGHKVTILTGFPNYPTGKKFPDFNYKNRLYKHEFDKNVEIIRTYNWFSKPGSFIDRILNAFSSMISNLIYGFLTKRRFNIVLATSPQPFILIQGILIARLHRIPFIAEIRDPWPEVVSIEGLFSKPLPYKMLGAYMKRMYHHCDMLVGVAENYRSLFSKKYGVPKQKIAIIPNGCNQKLFFPSNPKKNIFRQKYNLNGKFICSFVGNIGNFLRCEVIVKAAHTLKKYPDIIFIFVGSGAGLKSVKKAKKELKTDNVYILDYVPREEVPFVYQASNISIAHAMNHPYYRTCIGAKIWEIMGSGVPILVGFKGETKKIVEEAKAGYAFEPENEEELASLILKIKKDPKLAKELGQNGRHYILSGFTREQLASKYLQKIQLILGMD